jgi:hypothetical protein
LDNINLRIILQQHKNAGIFVHPDDRETTASEHQAINTDVYKWTEESLSKIDQMVTATRLLLSVMMKVRLSE